MRIKYTVVLTAILLVVAGCRMEIHSGGIGGSRPFPSEDGCTLEEDFPLAREAAAMRAERASELKNMQTSDH